MNRSEMDTNQGLGNYASNPHFLVERGMIEIFNGITRAHITFLMPKGEYRRCIPDGQEVPAGATGIQTTQEGEPLGKPIISTATGQLMQAYHSHDLIVTTYGFGHMPIKYRPVTE